MILLNPTYEYQRPVIESIPSRFETEGTTIYHLRNEIKVMETPDGKKLNVKRYHVPKGLNLLIYSWGLRKPKGLRAFEYPAILLQNGINTPTPIAYIEERSAGFIRYTYFISEQCDYPYTLYDMGNASPDQYKPMAKALAHLAATMHSKNILHLDFTPGNILWKRDADGYKFSLVDTNRMYFGPVSIDKGINNLKRMWGPKEFFILLMQHYAEERGANPQQVIAKALELRHKFWTHYQRKHDIPFKLEL
uniref:Tyrosine protein kinase n=3 Tax=unclassified Prevotella TaxID=2638335 RepID=A0AB33IY93_9BACT